MLFYFHEKKAVHLVPKMKHFFLKSRIFSEHRRLKTMPTNANKAGGGGSSGGGGNGGGGGDEPNTARSPTDQVRVDREDILFGNGTDDAKGIGITVATTTTRTRRTTTNYSTEMALRVQRWEMILLKAEKSTIDGG